MFPKVAGEDFNRELAEELWNRKQELKSGTGPAPVGDKMPARLVAKSARGRGTAARR